FERYQVSFLDRVTSGAPRVLWGAKGDQTLVQPGRSVADPLWAPLLLAASLPASHGPVVVARCLLRHRLRRRRHDGSQPAVRPDASALRTGGESADSG